MTPADAARLGIVVERPTLTGPALLLAEAQGTRRRAALGLPEPAPARSVVAPSLPSEHDEQVALAAALDAAGVLWCHVPNEARRTRSERGRLLGAGLKAGVPDVLVFDPAPTTGCPTALELKAPRLRLKRDAPPTPPWARHCFGGEQQRWLAALADRGWHALVAYSAAEAVAQLRALGYPL